MKHIWRMGVYLKKSKWLLFIMYMLICHLLFIRGYDVT